MADDNLPQRQIGLVVAERRRKLIESENAIDDRPWLCDCDGPLYRGEAGRLKEAISVAQRHLQSFR